jgi:hypothetical protein
LAEQLNEAVPALLAEFKLDMIEPIATCPVFRLGVTSGGNQFRLLGASGREYEPPAVPGLYTIFSLEAVVYFGEASDL